jgi:uncharacterized surface protein with fasciclin (FAS1) repeats
MKTLNWRMAASSIALMLAACATTPAPRNVADTVAGNAQLTTLNRLLKDADMTGALEASGPVTLFAPSDEAFKALPAATLSALSTDKARLKAVLAYHVVPANLTSADLQNGPVKTMQGGQVVLYRSGTFVTIEDAVVSTADLRATNGTVQIIDKVLIPH